MKNIIQKILKKSIRELSWNVTEEAYRADDSYSYSKLSAFLHSGPKVLVSEDRIDTEALRFGSLLDCLITEPETLKERFIISNYNKPSDTIIAVFNYIQAKNTQREVSLEKIPQALIKEAMDAADYAGNWGIDARIRNLLKHQQYFRLQTLTQDGKILVAQEDYDRAVACRDTLLSHPFTKPFMANEGEDIEHCYQIKFKEKLQGIPVRCMFDKLVVDHKNKTITPCDLKTTSKIEYKFEPSILEWNYYIQATMYSDILKQALLSDPYFKDFKVLGFHFIVINRFNQNPMVWEYPTDPANRVFQTFTDTLKEEGYPPYQELLNDVEWHKKHQKYSYPRDVYENNGVKQINPLKFL